MEDIILEILKWVLIISGIIAVVLLIIVIIMACKGMGNDLSAEELWFINPANPSSPLHHILPK